MRSIDNLVNHINFCNFFFRHILYSVAVFCIQQQYLIDIRFSETIHFAAQSRTVFLSNHINWGPQGRGWEFERNFELAHSSFWLLKFIVSQVQKLEYPSIFAGLLLLNKKRQNFALGAILKSTKKSFFSSWISSKLVKWHPSYKSPKLREVWENLKYYSNNPLYFVSLSLLNEKR